MIISIAFGLVCLGGALLFWIAAKKKLELSQKQIEESFKALSYDALDRAGRSFLDLAKTQLDKYQEGAKTDLEHRQKAIDSALQPIRESMKQLSEHQRELEKKREGAYSGISKQIEMLLASEKELRQAAAQLGEALRSPQARGSWGQVHLRRVVELAGLLNNCDFNEQHTTETEGKILRPDLVINLPGQRQIVVDAKVPLNAYLEAAEAENEQQRQKKFFEHAQTLRKHMRELSAKEYWKQFSDAPEYVILFLPAEAFFSAALQADPTLIEIGANQNVIVATPTTLIAILRAVAQSWKQESLSKNMQQIAKIGGELYERIGVVCDHWSKVGKSLNSAIDSYNQSIVSLESRLLVSARKLKETGVSTANKEPPELEQLDKLPKTFRHIEVAQIEEKE